MTTTKQHISEAEAVMLVRNALLVAGQEMGEGDQWPVIKSTINDIMQDYENLQIERNVNSEMKKHLYEQLEEMERILPTCPKDEQAEVAPLLTELREIYDAHFSEIDESKIVAEEENIPEHAKRASLIMSQLMEAEDE